MNKQRNILTAVCISTLLSGCATWQKTGIACTVGCGSIYAICYVESKNTGVCAGLAAACEATCLMYAYKQYRDTQTRTANIDRQVYAKQDPTFYRGANTAVKIRNSSSSPESVRAGDKLKVVTDYSVVAPQDTREVTVKESLVLKKNGNIVGTLAERSIQRGVAGWISEVDFPVSAKLPPGTYVIEHRVQAGTSYDSDSSIFVVRT